MQLDCQDFLRLVEKSSKMAFVDIESTGLKGDYNSILVVSIKPYGKAPYSIQCDEPGNDCSLVETVKYELEDYLCWVTYYGKGFDLPMINTRLLNWGMDPVKPKHHLDMYYALKSKILTGRKSQGHLLNWLETHDQKMSVSARDWGRVLDSKTRDKAMATMVKRCESDVKGLEALYRKTSHLIADVRRG